MTENTIILDTLMDNLTGKDHPVRGVCSGAFWTSVTTRETGLATTYRDMDLQHSDHPCFVEAAGRMLEMKAGELAELARSRNTVAASIGLATINSMLEVDEKNCVEAGAYDLLAEKGKGRNVAVVGHFPFIPKLREHARNLWVIEKRLRPGDLPADEAARILPKCEVVCLTGTALINHTLEELLNLCKDAYVVLTGPSSPLHPMLFDFGIDAICGTRVTNVEEANRYISQAASFKQIHHHGVRLLTMTAKP
jgi:uncharacterized protein